MGSSLNDLRNLNKEIERKKQKAEQDKRQKGAAEREMLSENMKAGIKERQAKAGKMASNTKALKTLISIIFIGALAIIAAFVVRGMMSVDSDPKKLAVLLDNDLQELDAMHEDYREVTTFFKKIVTKIQSGEDLDVFDWASNITDSSKERSLANLNVLSSGAWTIKTIGYNEKLGVYTIYCSESENGKEFTLRLTENKTYKLKLVKAY